MIKKTKKEVIEIKKYKEIFCDFCKKEISRNNWLGTGEYENYSKSESKIFYVAGSNYPSGVWEPEGEGYNCCGNCMKEIILPLIEKETKIKPQIIDGDELTYYDFD